MEKSNIIMPIIEGLRLKYPQTCFKLVGLRGTATQICCSSNENKYTVEEIVSQLWGERDSFKILELRTLSIKELRTKLSQRSDELAFTRLLAEKPKEPSNLNFTSQFKQARD